MLTDDAVGLRGAATLILVRAQASAGRALGPGERIDALLDAMPELELDTARALARRFRSASPWDQAWADSWIED